MFNNPLQLIFIVALLAVCQPQAGNTQPLTDSHSQASSTATESKLGIGKFGISRDVIKGHSQTDTNGGFEHGGSTSVADGKAIEKEIHLGRLELGSTLSTSKTTTNGKTSRGVAHSVNIGKLVIGSSLSKNNLHNRLGLHHSEDGDINLGLGLLNFDLHKKQKADGVQTQVQGQAEGEHTFATSDAKSTTQSKYIGRLGLAKSTSESNVLVGTNAGHTSASANGLAGGSAVNVYTS